MEIQKEDNILNHTPMNLQGSFEEQVVTILESICITKYEVENLRCVPNDVEKALSAYWPECKVILHGSMVTGLAFKTSDIDCYVQLPPSFTKPGKELAITTGNILRKHSNIFEHVTALADIRVPIVQLYHKSSGTPCDLAFSHMEGVKNSRLMYYLLHLDERAHILAILVKYWAKIHHLIGVDLLPTYALSILVIFFLQHVEILPNVASLQTYEECIDNWNVAFCEKRHTNSNTTPLYQLLGSFFVFYSTYDFKTNIISPYLGRSIPRDKFESVSKNFILYNENLKNNLCMPLKIDTFVCIQEPFDHSRNCTENVSPRWAENVLSYFRLAAEIYEKESNSTFLTRLLTLQTKANK